MAASTFVMVVALLDCDAASGRGNPSPPHEELDQFLGRHVITVAGIETGICPKLFFNGLQEAFHRVSVALHHFQDLVSVYHICCSERLCEGNDFRRINEQRSTLCQVTKKTLITGYLPGDSGLTESNKSSRASCDKTPRLRSFGSSPLSSAS